MQTWTTLDSQSTNTRSVAQSPAMPALEAFFHYRNLDVSTLKELCKRWRPSLAKELKKHGRHEALADIYESIDELRFYRDRFLRLE